MIYFYYCNSWEKADPDGEEHLFEFEHSECEDEWEREWLVEAIADDYHSNHDGWEHRSWQNGEPMEFWVFDSDKKMIGKYDVYIEYEPRFHSRRING